MKTNIFLVTFLAIQLIVYSQTIPFNYSIKLKPITIPNLPGLHSYVVAQSGGKWLIIGGRKDGLHARQPFNAFPVANNNSTIYVVDINTQQLWTSPVTVLATSLAEQMQSTNMNFYQDEDSLYIIGGYGYSATAADHITYPNLTSVSVSGLINAVINGSSIIPFFKQITDQNFAVNGGHLGKIDSTFYLIGGHRFDGRYNPMGNATYTQAYSDGLKKFKIINSGSQLNYSNYSVIIDQAHLHRRDYNLMPQIFPNGEVGYTISSGVFQIGLNLPFLYPVDIKKSGHTPVTSFNQYLSNYHSANTALYDSINNTMHSIFFGGMSQYSYVNNVLTQDNNVPFVKTISRVSRDSNGMLQENIFPNQMPALIGASAEFIPNHSIPHYKSEIIKLSKITDDSVLIGHMYGGIYSPQIDAFTTNNTSVTNAHNVIYEVWLIKDQVAGLKPLDGKNPLKAIIYPNPTKSQLNLNLELPYNGSLELHVTDVNGKIVAEKYFTDLQKGKQTFNISNQIKLTKGVYFFNFTFDGKFCAIEKVMMFD
jgi:hypothetical protein